MEILIFVLRTVFLVLIYVFIFVVLVHLIRDLRVTGEPLRAGDMVAGNVATPPARPFSTQAGNAGVLAVYSAPAEYGIEGAVYELPAETRLGRGKENHVVLPGRYASNHHAVIHLRNGQYWLEDLGSRNGTYLNGLPLDKQAVLAHGDQIRIGDIIFRFVRWDNAVEHDLRMRPGSLEK